MHILLLQCPNVDALTDVKTLERHMFQFRSDWTLLCVSRFLQSMHCILNHLCCKKNFGPTFSKINAFTCRMANKSAWDAQYHALCHKAVTSIWEQWLNLRQQSIIHSYYKLLASAYTRGVLDDWGGDHWLSQIGFHAPLTWFSFYWPGHLP